MYQSFLETGPLENTWAQSRIRAVNGSHNSISFLSYLAIPMKNRGGDGISRFR
jgi:hypothetical protein